MFKRRGEMIGSGLDAKMVPERSGTFFNASQKRRLKCFTVMQCQTRLCRSNIDFDLKFYGSEDENN